SIKHDQQINIKPAKINCNTSAEINGIKEDIAQIFNKGNFNNCSFNITNNN
ncbi:2132_t:CDS:1, partial [Entrophospora sp. SA101]